MQRVLKLTKYLPRHHVRPEVLTVANPSVPVLDTSLERDFPEDLRVIRTRTFEPAYAVKQAAWSAQANTRPSFRQRITQRATALAKQLLVPDPQILWQPMAQAAAFEEVVVRAEIDVVFISGPPFSQFLIAPLARLHPRVGVVLDYRDEWSTYRSTYEMMGGKLAKVVGDPLESLLLRTAHEVTTATEEFRDNLLQRFRFLEPGRVHAIPNGYDPEDFPTDIHELANKPDTSAHRRFVLAYAGTVFKLTSVRGLLGAIRRLHERAPDLAQLLEVQFIGRIVDTERDAFEGMDKLGVQCRGYMDHNQVLRELAASDMVLCTLDDVPGVERIYPAKIFELMYLGRPCLILSPPGALTSLVERHQLGDILPPRDEEKIAHYLEAKLRAFREKPTNGHKHPVGIERYSRDALAGEFASVFRSAYSRASD